MATNSVLESAYFKKCVSEDGWAKTRDPHCSCKQWSTGLDVKWGVLEGYSTNRRLLSLSVSHRRLTFLSSPDKSDVGPDLVSNLVGLLFSASGPVWWRGSAGFFTHVSGISTNCICASGLPAVQICIWSKINVPESDFVSELLFFYVKNMHKGNHIRNINWFIFGDMVLMIIKYKGGFKPPHLSEHHVVTPWKWIKNHNYTLKIH